MAYRAPTQDIRFALKHIVGLDAAMEKGLFGDLSDDLVDAVLEEAGRFAVEEIAPLNEKGDKEGAHLKEGKVVLPEGWAEVYRAWAEAGWGGLPLPEAYGGQGLPKVLGSAVEEMWNSANMAFALAPMLTQGAVDAIELHGSQYLKDTYLEKLTTGQWTGTMNLTEPQAGSDLGLLRMKAVPRDDGTYALSGTKIFITYGDHEMTENIVHLVLARLPDAPAGTRGISMFVVPKYLVNADGSLGARNDVYCTKLEHKLGIHASPTCVLNYGDNGGAIGWLIGEPHKGLKYMFTMMNRARLAVGVQGVAIAEKAFQHALAYANERRQGRALGAPPETTSLIVAHPDVRRMLLTQRALTAAARAICLQTAFAADMAERAETQADRQAAANRVALLTPIAKGFSTEIAVEAASLNIQVHGGMGYIEETGAAQIFRDSRILPIYEGTTGIQAMDLALRKIPLEDGAVLGTYLSEIRQTAQQAAQRSEPAFQAMGARLAEAITVTETTARWLADRLRQNPEELLAGATPTLRLFGLTAGAAALVTGALAMADISDDPLARERIGLAHFFAQNLLPETASLGQVVMEGAGALLTYPEEALST